MYTNKIVCFLNNTIQEISWISLYRDIFLISYQLLNFQYRPALCVSTIGTPCCIKELPKS